jgi:hypothetical protein
VPGLTDLEERCVVPFYLKMMGLNALTHDTAIGMVREVAHSTTDHEVTMLLASAWRPRVMGAWLASGRTERIEAALLKSLQTSAGLLTTPPLAAVALHGLGARAVPALQAYLRQDLENQWGAAAFTGAALERLNAAPPGVTVEDRDRKALDGMLAVAGRLAETPPDATSGAPGRNP